jgi:hypothetical protein
MKTILGKAVLGLALGASALTVSAPAQAQRWHGGGYRYHGGGAGGAIVAGLAGVAVGAAIASDHPRYYYDDGYYGPPAPAYYGYPGYYGYYGYPRYYYPRYHGWRGHYVYRGHWRR